MVVDLVEEEGRVGAARLVGDKFCEDDNAEVSEGERSRSSVGSEGADVSAGMRVASGEESLGARPRVTSAEDCVGMGICGSTGSGRAVSRATF